MKVFLASAALSLIGNAIIGITPASATELPRDLAALQRWVVENLNCSDTFTVGLQDRSFIDRMKALGVVVTTEWQEGDTPDGEFTLLAPVKFAGQSVTHFRYWADSGGEFYAIVDAPAEILAKALGAEPVPDKLRHDVGDETVAIRFIRAESHVERYPPAVFVRHAGSGSETGCRFFDG